MISSVSSRSLIAFMATVFSIGSVRTVDATIVVVTDRTTWLAQTGGVEAIDEFTAADGPLTGNPTTRNATGSTNRSYDAEGGSTNLFISSNALTTQNNDESITFSNFTPTASAVGFNLWLDNGSGPVNGDFLTLNVNSGTFSQNYQVDGTTNYFLGIYDDAGGNITSVLLTTASGNAITVDNLEFATYSGGGGGGGASVPEPTSFALLGLGSVVGLVAYRRRRNNAC